MLTRDEYDELLRSALNQCIRYANAYPSGAHIVFVASPSVLGASYIYAGGLYFGSYWTLYGREVYLLDGCDDENILAPALKWYDSEDRISLSNDPLVGDLLIDGDRLYIYTTERTYQPTGYTVQNGLNALNMEDRAFTINASSISTDYFTTDQYITHTMSVSGPCVHSAHPKAYAEKELDPGDTKAIDDYLQSFTRQTMLSGA